MRCPPAGQRLARTTARSSFGCVSRIAIDLRELSGHVSRYWALGCLTACARRQPLRGLPSGAPIKPCMERQKHSHQHGRHGDEEGHQGDESLAVRRRYDDGHARERSGHACPTP